MTFPLLAMAIILIPIVICSLLLLAPFHLSLKLDINGLDMEADYQVRWLGLTLKKGEIPPPGAKDIPGEEKEQAREKKEGEKPKAESEQMPKSLASVDPRSFMEALPAILRVLKNLIKSIDIDRLICRISFGLNNPAETAVLSGYLWSLASAVGLSNTNVFIDPRFDEERLVGDLAADFKARLLWVVVALLLALREDKLRKLLGQMAKGARA
jgi:hypothetical protein